MFRLVGQRLYEEVGVTEHEGTDRSVVRRCEMVDHFGNPREVFPRNDQLVEVHEGDMAEGADVAVHAVVHRRRLVRVGRVDSRKWSTCLPHFDERLTSRFDVIVVVVERSSVSIFGEHSRGVTGHRLVVDNDSFDSDQSLHLEPLDYQPRSPMTCNERCRQTQRESTTVRPPTRYFDRNAKRRLC